MLMKIQRRRDKTRRHVWLVGAAVFAGVLLVLGLQRYHTAPLDTAATLETIALKAPAAKPLAWPNYGQAAVATHDYGVLATHGSKKPQPTASTAKLITALAIMQKKPFADEKGATITFSATDVQRYHDYVAGNGSVTAVTEGTSWTQYQALQAVLLASANNVSDSLAVWAFGSLEAYREYASRMVQKIGMKDTRIGTDASGYSATTTSTAHDLALLAREVLASPMLRQIVRQAQAELPAAGAIQSTNRLLPHSDIIGMKTGYISEAGGVFVLAGTQKSGRAKHDIITVVMGAPGGSSHAAQDAAYALYTSAKANFAYREIVAAGQRVGAYRPAWSGEAVPLVAAQSAGMFVWSGAAPEARTSTEELRPGAQGNAGAATVKFGEYSTTIPLKTTEAIPEPPLWWRVVGRDL